MSSLSLTASDPPMRDMGRVVRRIVLLSAAITLLLAACGTAAPLPPGGHPRLTSIVMLSSTEGWAAGEGGTILHYHDGQWVHVDEPSGADLNAIAMVSPTEGWAVGLDSAEGKGIILRDHAGQWSANIRIMTPALRAITLVSPAEGWAVGDGGTILHLSGGQWTRVPSPTTADLMAVTMVSSTEGWATGYNLINTAGGGMYNSDILHYTGGKWMLVTTVLNARYYGVAATPNDNWLVGASAQGEATILYGVRNIWTPAGGHINYVLTAITLVSPTEGWAVGYHGTIVHDVLGSWTVISAPTTADLFGITMLSPKEGWAVGDQSTILRFHNGVWSVFGQ